LWVQPVANACAATLVSERGAERVVDDSWRKSVDGHAHLAAVDERREYTLLGNDLGFLYISPLTPAARLCMAVKREINPHTNRSYSDALLRRLPKRSESRRLVDRVNGPHPEIRK